MEPTEIKKALMNEFFTLKSYEIQKKDNLIGRLENYLSKESDEELMLVLLTLKTQSADTKHGFAKACEIAAPIYIKLESITNWGYTVLHILSIVVGHHPDFNKTLEFFQEAIDIIEDEHADDPKFRGVKNALHANFTLRIPRAIYSESNHNIEKLGVLFDRSYKHAIEAYTKKNSPLQHLLKARCGLVKNDLQLIDSALSSLRELKENKVTGASKLYKDAKDEIAEFVRFIPGDRGTDLTKLIIGHQLTKRMEELNLKPVDIANALDIDPNAVTAIMRGEAGVSTDRLYNISRIIGTSTDYLYGHEESESEDLDPILTTIKVLIADYTDSEKELSVSLIRAIGENKHLDRSKSKDKKSNEK